MKLISFYNIKTVKSVNSWFLISFDEKPILFMSYSDWSSFLGVSHRVWYTSFVTNWVKCYYNDLITNFCEVLSINKKLFPFYVEPYDYELSVFIVNSERREDQIHSFMYKNPGAFVFMLSKLRMIYYGHHLFSNQGYFNVIDFKYLYFNFQQLYKLLWFCIKVYVLEINSFQTEKNQLGYVIPRQIKPLIKAIVFFIYENKKNYRLNIISKFNINLLNCLLYFTYYLKIFKKLLKYRFNIIIRLNCLITPFIHLWNQLSSLTKNLINTLPFTFLLFYKFNLNADWAVQILVIFIGYRLFKIITVYFIHIWQTFYAPVWANAKIRHYTFIPTILTLNLGSIYLIFKFLEECHPRYQFLGVLLFVLLKNIVLDDLFNKIINIFYSLVDKYHDKERYKQFLSLFNINKK